MPPPPHQDLRNGYMQWRPNRLTVELCVECRIEMRNLASSVKRSNSNGSNKKGHEFSRVFRGKVAPSPPPVRDSWLRPWFRVRFLARLRCLGIRDLYFRFARSKMWIQYERLKRALGLDYSTVVLQFVYIFTIGFVMVSRIGQFFNLLACTC